MQDELWMRTWNDGHDRFSADVDRGFKRLAGSLAGLLRRAFATKARKQAVRR